MPSKEKLVLQSSILFVVHRHPEHSSRPSFLVLLKELSKSPDDLLSWPEADTSGLDQQARTLGAPLEAGRNLYPELRGIYN